MGQARWRLSVVLTFGALFGGWACGSSTEIPTVAEDPWAVPEEEPEPEPEPDAGPDISTFPPCGNGGMCNPNNLGGETCQGLGMGEGILACDAVTCTYDTSMCEGTGSGNGGNGSVGVGNGNSGNGNGNGSMGGANGGQNLPFFGTDESGTGNSGGAGSGAADGGNKPQFFGGGFFGGSFFGGGGDDQNGDEVPGNGNRRDEDPMDAGVRLDASL